MSSWWELPMALCTWLIPTVGGVVFVKFKRTSCKPPFLRTMCTVLRFWFKIHDVCCCFRGHDLLGFDRPHTCRCVYWLRGLVLKEWVWPYHAFECIWSLTQICSDAHIWDDCCRWHRLLFEIFWIYLSLSFDTWSFASYCFWFFCCVCHVISF